jgi:hypothetical protein
MLFNEDALKGEGNLSAEQFLGKSHLEKEHQKILNAEPDSCSRAVAKLTGCSSMVKLPNGNYDFPNMVLKPRPSDIMIGS